MFNEWLRISLSKFCMTPETKQLQLCNPFLELNPNPALILQIKPTLGLNP